MQQQTQNQFAVVSAGESVTRRLLADNEALMTVEFVFKENAIGALYSHPHF